MGYKINNMIIDGLPKTKYRNGVGAYEGVVAHSTDDLGATAKAIRNWESRTYDNAFVHYAVDWNEIVQIADINYLCYGAGPKANPRFVSVELCETDDKAQFDTSYAMFVWLLAKILYDKKLGVTLKGTLWGHDDVTKILGGTTHDDPYPYLAKWGIAKDEFVSDVKSEYDKMSGDVPYKVIIPNTAHWQAVLLVQEFEKRGYRCEGISGKVYGPNDKPQDGDPCAFVIYTTLNEAKKLVIELQTRNYPLTYGEKI